MKPPPQPHKIYVMILHIFDIVYILRYNFFQITTVDKKIHRRMSED